MAPISGTFDVPAMSRHLSRSIGTFCPVTPKSCPAQSRRKTSHRRDRAGHVPGLSRCISQERNTEDIFLRRCPSRDALSRWLRHGYAMEAMEEESASLSRARGAMRRQK